MELKIFTIISFVSGVSMALLSLAGHILTPGSLIPSTFTGGAIGVLAGCLLCKRLKTIDGLHIFNVILFTLLAYGYVSFIIVFNFRHPPVMIGGFFLIGLTAVCSNLYFETHPGISKNKIYSITGLLFLLPVFYFITASILNFQLGIPFLFIPVQAILNLPHGQQNFNAITPLLFAGGLILSFLLNAFSQVSVTRKSKHFFDYRISGWHFNRYNMALTIVSGGVAILLAGYLLVENIK